MTHDATLRLLAGLRLWIYRHLEPLAPVGLQRYHSGDLLSRIRADIDTLDHFYLRFLVPVTVALLGATLFVLFLWRYHPMLALIEPHNPKGCGQRSGFVPTAQSPVTQYSVEDICIGS